jgi:hypothetical protein
VAKPPSWNEIRANATTFVERWEGTADENAEAQSFWNEFLGIFGIDRKRVATFEARARRTSTGGRGRIDLFWPGTLVAEHKSAGKDLTHAEEQALDYLDSIDQDNFPGVIITSDFGNFRVRDLGGDNEPFTFPLSKLPEEIDRFGFIAGYQKRKFGDAVEVEANIQAAKLMGDLYEELARTGYEGHDASVLMTRLLFLMFGDDTGMWEKGLFGEFIETRTNQDGSDLGSQLAFLFQILDKAEEKRPDTMDELLQRFPYVNGHLFSDRIDIPAFDRRMRDELVKCTEFDWSKISPAVFGSLFQAVKSKEARRTLGEHYTTEHNIMRALAPLFLDELWAEYQSIKDNAGRLERFHDKLADIKVMDPACGCGNFLVIAFRELRRLELATLTRLQELRGEKQLHLDVSTMVRVTLNNFYGIEIEEWPARIAETAMFLVDQQANHELARQFGQAPDRLPIMQAARITIGNALRIDWESVVPASECSYIVGNPPFVGMTMMNKEQQDDNRFVFSELGGTRTGRLDYVACWYAKAITYMKGHSTKAALVSTNSITQGEQARTLGPLFKDNGFDIYFAHRTFAWKSEAPGAANVHVVIVGFSHIDKPGQRRLFDYPDPKGEPIEVNAKQINFYLADADSMYPDKRTRPFIPDLPLATKGSQPTDGGHLLVSEEEYSEIVKDPIAAKYLRLFRQGQDFLNGGNRWCLWLAGATPAELSGSPLIRKRLAAVAEERRGSKTESVRAQAATPALFTQNRQPSVEYLAVPEVSSERRSIVPAAYLEPDVVAGNKLITFAAAPMWLFGFLQSAMWSAWLRTIGGRLESRISFSPDLTYCTFPFPSLDESTRERISTAAEKVLAVRAIYKDSTLAQLYDPLTMPVELVRAHEVLDAAVDLTYGARKFVGESDRLEVLFARYAELVEEDKLFSDKPEKKTRKKKS